MGKGIGSDIAKNVLQEGGSIIIGDLIENQLIEIRDEIDPRGERSLAKYLNLSDKKSC